MTLYLDTSSLVKLYVTETGSDTVRRLVEGANVVATSVVAYAEARAAFARLRRDGGLVASAFASIKRDFEADWPTYLTLEVTHAVCREAGDLAERFRLRGFDGLHLASFADVYRRAARPDTRFSSFDIRLNEAAQKLSRALASRVRGVRSRE